MAAAADVQIVNEGSIASLVLTGEIDVSVAPQLLTYADRLLASAPSEVVIDLADTTFLDSAGVGALVALRNAAAQAGVGSVRLRPGPSNVMRVLGIVGLTDTFDEIV